MFHIKTITFSYYFISGVDKKKCYRKILTVENLVEKRKCVDMTGLFFYLNQNQFIYKESNKIIIEKLNQLKNEEIQKFWEYLTNFIHKTKQFKLLSESFILNNFQREFKEAFNCNIKATNFLICQDCKNIVKNGQEIRHTKLCKKRICGFKQIDGYPCNSLFHTKKLHLNFFPFDYIIKEYALHENVITKLQNNLIQSKNNSIIIHSDEIKNTISFITETFKNQFRVLSKKCNCLKFSNKFCNCFLHVLNNADTMMYFERKRKNIYFGMKDIISKKQKILAIINVNYKENEFADTQEFDFFQNLRKNQHFKLIFLVENKFNAQLIKKNVFKRQNISYQHSDMS